MIIGIPEEIKDNEYRVSLTPEGAETLVQAGHRVLVEKGAGQGSGFSDKDYVQAGSELVQGHCDVFYQAEMILKVKEPIPSEYELVREGLVLFTFLNLATDRELTHVLVQRKVTSVAYETIELPDGSLPLLRPVAGKLAVQVAAHYLEKVQSGQGKLPSVPPCSVVILGAGAVVRNAALIAQGIGASVTVIDRDIARLRHLSEVLHGNLTTLSSNSLNIARAVRDADVLIVAVLVPGASAPCLVTSQMVSTMRPGSVVIDISIDQGGCIETSRPSTHSEPTYLVDGVVHYGVTNMPGIVPRTSTYALSMVKKGARRAIHNRY